MSEPTQPASEVIRELAHRMCRLHGHALEILDVRTARLDHAPVGVRCARCKRHWSVLPGTGGINLGEGTP